MATTVTGSPLAPFADAIYARLNGDATLLALVTGVYASLPEASRTAKPYVVVGYRSLGKNAGAMQREGGNALVTVDVFSDFNGPQETQDIQARIRQLLQRADLPVPGFVLYGGSLECEEELCLSESDPDMPLRGGYHGVQQWVGLLEEAI